MYIDSHLVTIKEMRILKQISKL